MGENKLPMPIIAGGAVVLAVIAGVVGWQFMPKSAPAVKTDDTAKAFINQKAMECQGDANKLSPADREKLIKMVGGANWLPMVMSRSYQNQTGKK
jgi:hypothetical protein